MNNAMNLIDASKMIFGDEECMVTTILNYNVKIKLDHGLNRSYVPSRQNITKFKFVFTIYLNDDELHTINVHDIKAKDLRTNNIAKQIEEGIFYSEQYIQHDIVSRKKEYTAAYNEINNVIDLITNKIDINDIISIQESYSLHLTENDELDNTKYFIDIVRAIQKNDCENVLYNPFINTLYKFIKHRHNIKIQSNDLSYYFYYDHNKKEYYCATITIEALK